ncbi:MAG: iron-containing alcohol dehydrogenase [Euryarchaeota archaeon]|nr:iron-containing alcohol dehydrogenase [Euryarchaeota archaeon]
MLDFEYTISTKIFFGKNKTMKLGNELNHYTKRMLLVYGGGSIKQSGIYDSVHKIIREHNITCKELSGVQPNPRISSVRNGIKLCRQNGLDFILAVGGGSVIDCAKAIAAGVPYDGDPWDLFLQGDSKIKRAIPIGTILTIAGTGSEMNGNAVITNEETAEKLAIHSDLIRPKFSILDPTNTFTVPKEQTAAGTVDIMSHIFEQYFSLTKGAFIQDRLAESMLSSCIHYGPIVMNEPENYEARANLMWTSSLALNGLLSYGKITDWATHAMEHALSAMYDVTHGVGLAIIIPHWMEYVLNDTNAYKFADYAKNVWGFTESDDMSLAKESIEKTKEFVRQLDMPTTLRDVGVNKHKLTEMAKKSVPFGDIGKFKKLNERDVLTILKNAF